MTTECYYGSCKYHGSHTGPDEGPFCFEENCLATPEQLIAFGLERRNVLESLWGPRGPLAGLDNHERVEDSSKRTL